MIDNQYINGHILDLLLLQPQLPLHGGKEAWPFGSSRLRGAIGRRGRVRIERRYLIRQTDVPDSHEPRFIRDARQRLVGWSASVLTEFAPYESCKLGDSSAPTHFSEAARACQ